jgi:hypothetical protein
MPHEPYPGISPLYKVVSHTAGFSRTCLVIELLSVGGLSEEQLSFIRDQVDGFMERLGSSLAELEKSKTIIPQQFDTLLRQGLRLP